MQGIGTGAGLAAIGFWGFVAIVVVAGIWDNIRKREAQHETLRRMMESDRPLDQALMDKLFSLTGSGHQNLERDLMVWGLIVLFVAPGLALLGWFVSLLAAPALFPILGAAGLLVFVALGLLLAAKAVGRRSRDDDTSLALRSRD